VPRKSAARPPVNFPTFAPLLLSPKFPSPRYPETINGSPLVSDRLSKRVWQAIKQLNYLPNTHARTLVSGRSRLLGIIVENITNPSSPN